MAVGNTNFATLASTTLQNHSNEIFDNVVTNHPLLNELKKGGNIKIVGGGRQFTHPVFYAKNSNFAAISKLGTIPTATQDNLTRAVYDIKVIAGSLALSQVELAMNAGNKEKLIDLLEEAKMEAEVSLGEILGDQLFKSSVGANDFDSIPRLISTTPSTQSDVGGIDSSATGQEYWQNYVYTTTVSAFGTSQAGLNAMDTCLNNATFGKQGPKIIITTKAIWTLYQLALTSNARYTRLPENGDGAFKSLDYATLPVYFDDDCIASRMYFIDTSAIRLQVLSDGNFKMTGFQQTQNQLTQTALAYLLANLTCGSRRTNAVISTISG